MGDDDDDGDDCGVPAVKGVSYVENLCCVLCNQQYCPLLISPYLTDPLSATCTSSRCAF